MLNPSIPPRCETLWPLVTTGKHKEMNSPPFPYSVSLNSDLCPCITNNFE